MYFDSWAEFVAMGRHGTYVWLSYGCFVLIVLWNLLLPWLHQKRVAAANLRWVRRNAAVDMHKKEKNS